MSENFTTPNVTTPRLNPTLNSQTPYKGYEVENIVSAVFYSILAIVVIVGNCLVIIAFKVNYKLRTVTNLCFVSLALCDLLVGCVSIPLWIYYTFVPGSGTSHLYLFFISFDIFNGAASIFQLTAISLERCFSIVAPVRHHSMPVMFYYIMVLVVWILAAFSSLLRLLPYNKLTEAGWYNVYAILVCFVLPVFIMGTSYALLFRTAMKRSKHGARSSRNSRISISSQLKTVVTLLIVTGLFVVAWSPFFTVTALARYIPYALPRSTKDQIHLWRFVKWMHYSNSSINPFVYAFRNREFNYSFRMILRAFLKCKRFEEVNRQFKKTQRFHLRNHTKDSLFTSQSLCKTSSGRSKRSSSSAGYKQTETNGERTIVTRDIELDILNGNVKM